MDYAIVWAVLSIAVAFFARSHPCPATAQPSLPCPGWIIDHIEPLCSGGPDAPANMQWQTVADALKKDIDERRACRAAR